MLLKRGTQPHERSRWKSSALAPIRDNRLPIARKSGDSIGAAERLDKRTDRVLVALVERNISFGGEFSTPSQLKGHIYGGQDFRMGGKPFATRPEITEGPMDLFFLRKRPIDRAKQCYRPWAIALDFRHPTEWVEARGADLDRTAVRGLNEINIGGHVATSTCLVAQAQSDRGAHFPIFLSSLSMTSNV